MPQPAGDLETLWPPSDNARPAPSATTALTRRARIGLFVSLVIFTIGALAQLLATAWFALLLALFGGSAEILVHTGGLDRRTFGVSSIAAVVLDAVILLAIASSSVHRTIRTNRPPRERFAVRHPFATTSVWMVLALAFVTACGWRPSPYFPYPLATIIVLANTYWFGLVGVFAMARLADLAWRAVKAWGIASEWRTGFLTACLLLVGGAGYWLLTTQWYAAPLHDIQARLEIEGPSDSDLLSSELTGFCLAANELEPVLAHSSAASGCGSLGGDTKRRDDCFSTLMKHAVPAAKHKLRYRGLNPHDVDDAIMKALLATCTREPPPRDLAAYFFAAARNHVRRTMNDARRTVSCDSLEHVPAACASSEPPDVRESKLARLWDDAICSLSDDTAEIFRRRLEQDESFREIGEHLGITETRAKDTFHNAIKKLRTQALRSCDAEWL